MKSLIIFVLLLLPILSFTVQAQSSEAQSYIEKIRKDKNLPALVFARINNNNYEEFISGYRNIETQEKIKASDSFHLSSCTKTMVATLIAVLVEQKKLQWTSTLGDLLPDVSMRKDYLDINLKDLAAHVSGITGDNSTHLSKSGVLTSSASIPRINDKDVSGIELSELLLEVTTSILSLEPASIPKTKYEYSNLNYVVLAAVIERVTRKTWTMVLYKELFQPLKMNSCYVGLPPNPQEQPYPHRIWSEGTTPAAYQPSTDSLEPPALFPSMGVSCNMRDWSKFAQLHLDGFKKNTKILKKSSFKVLHTPYPMADSEYTPGGWHYKYYPKQNLIELWHAGTNMLNTSKISVYPQHNFAVMGATNSGPGKISVKVIEDGLTYLIN